MTDTLYRFGQGKTTPQEEQQLLEWMRNTACKQQIVAYYRQQWDNASPLFPANTEEEILARIRQKIQTDRIPFRRVVVTPKKEINPIRRFLRIVGVAAAVIALIVVSFRFGFEAKESMLAKGEMVESYVPLGSREQVILPDGSTAWLNAGTVLLYPKEFKGNTRSVYLSGEANFSVEKNPHRPFIVRTKHLDVEALGTVFCVESYPGDRQTSATLESGSIRVDHNTTQTKSVLLKPNQRLVFDHFTGRSRISVVDAREYASWIDGYMVFKDETFDRIATTLERQYNITIHYPEEKFRGKRFYLRFVPDESLGGVLNVLSAAAGGFRYTVRDAEVTIR